MQTSILKKLFGEERAWHGSCTLILNANISVKSSGPDTIINSGTKIYSPRVTSGHLRADSICFDHVDELIIAIQRTEVRLSTGEEKIQEMVILVDIKEIAAIEFDQLKVLENLGIRQPQIIRRTSYAPGMLVG